MEAEIRILTDDQIDESLDKSIKEGLCTCFPADEREFSRSRGWHGTMPSWSVLIEKNSQVLAHVGMVDRVIAVGNEQVRVAGVQNVFVLPDHRKSGYFLQIMKASIKEAGRLGYDFGLLFCVPELEKLYALCRWKTLSIRKVRRLDENGEETDLPSKNISMYHPLARSEFPDGDIHMQGNDW